MIMAVLNCRNKYCFDVGIQHCIVVEVGFKVENSKIRQKLTIQ